MNITIKDAPKEGNYVKGFKSWHTHKIYKGPEKGYYGELVISDCSGGCGMQQLYGWVGVTNLEYADILIKEVLKTLNDGVGMIICQVGQPYYKGNFVKALESNGFTILTELPNYRHCSRGTYTQRLYSYIIKK